MSSKTHNGKVCSVSEVSVVSLVCCRPAGIWVAQLFSLLFETLSAVFNTHMSLQVSISALFAVETIGQGKTPTGTWALFRQLCGRHLVWKLWHHICSSNPHLPPSLEHFPMSTMLPLLPCSFFTMVLLPLYLIHWLLYFSLQSFLKWLKAASLWHHFYAFPCTDQQCHLLFFVPVCSRLYHRLHYFLSSSRGKHFRPCLGFLMHFVMLQKIIMGI